MDVASASDSSDIVEVIEQESYTESCEDSEDIGHDNNSRRQSTFSRSGKTQGNWLTLKWFGD